MTNENAFICAVKGRGKSFTDLCKATGINRQTMFLKRKNVREFKSSEIKSIVSFLGLSVDEMLNIFFADEVDETGTGKEVQS